MELVLAILAFGHHLGDAFLDNKGSTKNKRLFWAGIGCGWSLFFLGATIYQRSKPQMVETRADTIRQYWAARGHSMYDTWPCKDGIIRVL